MRRLFLVISLFVPALFLLQCHDSQLDDEFEGVLRVTMFDEPANYDTVLVEIASIEAHRQSGEQDSGWIELSDDTLMIDLLMLIDGEEQVLGEASVEPGVIEQLRMTMGENNRLVIGENSYDLDFAGEGDSEIILDINAEIEEGRLYDLFLDFDVSQSIVSRGEEEGYDLQPEIRVIRPETSGDIIGEVQPAEHSGQVYAAVGDDTIRTFTSDEGTFMLRGLEDGNWTVIAKSTSEDYTDGIMENVGVRLGETTEIDTLALQPVEE